MNGSFGLLAGHEPFITCLGFGLARYQRVGGPWEYLALPGAVLHLHQGELLLCTRRYFRGTDYGRISALLREELAEEERLEEIRSQIGAWLEEQGVSLP